MIVNVSVVSFRSRYYVIWLISQISIDMSGISYSRETDSYNYYETCRPWDVEWTYWDAKRRVLVGWV